MLFKVPSSNQHTCPTENLGIGSTIFENMAKKVRSN